MAVKIKLKRLGKIHRPQYRIVVADSRTKRDGRAIEEIGRYDPLPNPSVVEIDSERAQYWLGVGAKPTEAVQKLLALTGDWQKFTGEGDTSGSLEVAPPKVDKGEVYAQAVAAAGSVTEEETLAAAEAARLKASGPAEAEVEADEAVAEEAAEEAVEEAVAEESAEEAAEEAVAEAEEAVAEAEVVVAEEAAAEEAEAEAEVVAEAEEIVAEAEAEEAAAEADDDSEK